jgi:hypothetical protein
MKLWDEWVKVGGLFGFFMVNVKIRAKISGFLTLRKLIFFL